jgi:hypothetical protein
MVGVVVFGCVVGVVDAAMFFTSVFGCVLDVVLWLSMWCRMQTPGFSF